MKQDDTDFELLPHKELEHLRAENDRLRQNPFKGRVEPHDLQGSVDKLTDAITKLTKLFSATNEEMLADYQRGTLQEHIRQISSQNEKIAEGIVTLAEMMQPQEQMPAESDNFVDENQVMPEQSFEQGIPQQQEMNPNQQFAQQDQQMNSQMNSQMSAPMNSQMNQQNQAMPDFASVQQQGYQQPQQAPQTLQSQGMPNANLPVMPPPPPEPEKKKGFGLFKK